MPRGVALLVLALTATAAKANATVNLPLHHWAYEAIERLSAMGLVNRAMLAPKPYSRKEAAGYVAQALESARHERVSELLLSRLAVEFRAELSEPRPVEARQGARLQTEVNAASIGAGQSVRFRENRGGEYYADGVHVQADLRGWVEVGDRAIVTVQPKFVGDPHGLGHGATQRDEYIYIRELGFKVTRFNVSLEVGRSSLWWGHGHHGSLLLTDHAFPLDMIRLGSEEAFQLPGKLSGLGDWKVQTFLAQLERERDFPRAKLFGLRISSVPLAWLELGVTRLTLFDGEGQSHSFPDTVIETYVKAPNQAGDMEVNEQAMIDFRATLSGMQLYGELGSEDKWSKTLPSRAAFLAGIYIPQLLRGDSLDLRIEYADTDFTRRNSGIAQVWYNHGTYRSGMRLRGFPLGHHMGTDATDLFVRATRYMTDELRLGTSFNLQERDRGQAVYETKREAAIDLTWWPSSRAQLTLGYAYQRLKNPGQISDVDPYAETFAPGVATQNHLLWTRLELEL